MKKMLKKIFVILFCAIFAFSPLIFAGCDLLDVKALETDETGTTDTSGTGTGGTGSGDSTQTNKVFNINEYISGIKVAYTANASSSTQDENVLNYANEVVLSTQMMSGEILMRLMQTYGIKNFAPTINCDNGTDTIKKDLKSQEISYTFDEEFKYNGDTYIYEQNSSYALSIVYSNGEVVNGWNFFDTDKINGGSTSGKTWDNYLQNNIKVVELFTGEDFSSNNEVSVLKISNTKDSNLNKLAYAILSIKQYFENAKESDFDTIYSAFTNNYDNLNSDGTTDFYEKAKEIALNVKYNGILSKSLEEKALNQFVLDYVIGSEIVSADQKNFEIYKDGTYQTNLSNEYFVGEPYYYNQSAVAPQNEGDNYDISLYINNAEEIDQVATKLGNIYTNNAIKLWQDIDGDNEPDIVYVDGTNIPKYRANIYFRNYINTVKSIIYNVLTDTTNKIQVKQSDNTYLSINYETNYPAVSNIFSKDYSYSQIEASNNTSDDLSCRLPRLAYKNFVFCLTNKEKNNIGEVFLMLESSSGVSVDVSLYARYYRKGSGYATWDGTGLEDNTFYPIVQNKTVNGPYSFKWNSSKGTWDEGILEAIDFQELFKTAKFDGKENANKFDYEYQEDGETKTAEIFEIKQFPTNYFDSNLKKAGHSTLFSTNTNINPNYDVINSPKNDESKVFSYSSDNLSAEAEDYEYVEIVFVTSNENPFTFGLVGYIPASESYGD